MTHGMPTSSAQLAAMRRQFGLDLPMWRQFTDYCANALTGDLGTSYQFHAPVGELIGERLPATLLLTGVAVVIYSAIGLWLGTRSAWRNGSLGDKLNTGVALTLWSVPSFWLGLLLIITFSVGIGPIPGLFPTGGMESGDKTGLAYVGDVAHHMVLPVITLVAVGYAQTLLVMRSSLLDEMGSDYLTTARAKGLRPGTVLSRHAMRNMLIPVITVIGLQIGNLLGGAVIVETVFGWPGIGRLLVDAISQRDYPLVQATILLITATFILINLLVDLSYGYLDPRIRLR